jgi:hypothetical protein
MGEGMIKIDEPSNLNEEVLYYSNCLTCNNSNDIVLNIITTNDKYKAMIVANQHLLKYGDGHKITITYSTFL